MDGFVQGTEGITFIQALTAGSISILSEQDEIAREGISLCMPFLQAGRSDYK
jgi:hypothetical protein